jgi:hypothetical protein
MLHEGVVITEVRRAEPKPGKRAAAAVPPLVVEVAPEADNAYVLAARQPSGALSFHVATPTAGRRSARARASGTLLFEVSLAAGAPIAPRRGLASRAIELVLLKIARKVVDAVAPRALESLEASWWGQRPLGLVKVTREGLLSGDLLAAEPPIGAGPSGRALLLLHGTFSSTVGSFGGLATSKFFGSLAGLYGPHIYGFDHLTLSKSPLENAEDLLRALPTNAGISFDAVGFSRGGLVLRTLSTGTGIDARLAKRFHFNRGVLVAVPNQGTPLATPARWRETVGWFANILEMFPDGPLTTAAKFVATGIVWIAEAASAYAPGLAAMDTGGLTIADLRDAPPPEPGRYSALAANFTPSGGLLNRLVDMGVDTFFAGANDLVVPTEGGWRIDVSSAAIADTDVGCYGPGGNLGQTTEDVHHLNILKQGQIADFIARALRGEPHPLTPMDFSELLPRTARLRRGQTLTLTAVPTLTAATPGPSRTPAVPSTRVPTIPETYSDAFHILIVEQQGPPDTETDGASPAKRRRVGSKPQKERKDALLIASYGGARIVVPFRYSGGADGERSRKIIARNEQIKKYVDGLSGSTPPSEADLLEFGRELFAWIFPSEVRGLYDVARTLERNNRLNLIITCMIPWVAEKPIEFAYDPLRKTFLATEEIHLIRNVLTAVPADKIEPTDGKLRILVAIAQPIGLGELSADDEAASIRRGFAPLVETGLVEIDIMRSATPAALHARIMACRYDVVHFIGHGDWENDEGQLVFEDDRGNSAKVPVRTAREILCQRGVKLIFLNACDTGRGGYADFNSGIAQGLVAGGVPAVVANQFKVLDPSATAFAQHFYWSLAQGHSLGSAAREARIAVNYSIWGENIDWAVPVVYARDPDGRLCVPRPLNPDFNVTPSRTVRARRGAERHRWRIAVWDVNYSFPRLEATLNRMNAVQNSFGFELVDTSAPVGTWRMEDIDGDGEDLQLDAEHAARKLRGKASELGVDYLLCLTDKRIIGSDWIGLYAWWWEDDDPADLPRNIFFFSTDIEDLVRTGPTADRTISNLAVTALCAMMVPIEMHPGGRGKNGIERRLCPMFENNDVELAYVEGSLTFCGTCIEELTEATGSGRFDLRDADIEALKTLLRVFD